MNRLGKIRIVTDSANYQYISRPQEVQGRQQEVRGRAQEVDGRAQEVGGRAQERGGLQQDVVDFSQKQEGCPLRNNPRCFAQL